MAFLEIVVLSLILLLCKLLSSYNHPSPRGQSKDKSWGPGRAMETYLKKLEGNVGGMPSMQYLYPGQEAVEWVKTRHEESNTGKVGEGTHE